MVDSITDKWELLVIPCEKKKRLFRGISHSTSFIEEILFKQANRAWLQKSIYRIYASRGIMT